MENKIQIGDTVITRKFDDTSNCNWLHSMTDYTKKEGVVSGISCRGNYEVHGNYWPPSAVELVTKQWEPKPGEIFEWDDCRQRVSGVRLLEFGLNATMYSVMAIDSEFPVIVESSRLTLQKTLREQISEILYESPEADTKALDRIMEVIERRKE